MEKENDAYTIFYDDSCRICTVATDSILAFDSKKKFKSQRVASETLPSMIKIEDAMNEIHVVDTHGKVYKNIDAVFTILQQYRIFRPLVRIGQIPSVHSMLKRAYFIVARKRRVLSRYL